MEPLAWARRITPGPRLIFLGAMLPIQLSSLVFLCLRWQDQRWQPTAVAVFLGFAECVATLSARFLSKVQMTRLNVASLAAANTILAAIGSLAVAPGTTDAFAYWVAGDSVIVIAAIYFVRGRVSGLTTLALKKPCRLASWAPGYWQWPYCRRMAGASDYSCHRLGAGDRLPNHLPRLVHGYRISAG